jgi:hypothetical protein
MDSANGGDTAPILPRPGVVARAVQRAKADLRVARATEMERLIIASRSNARRQHSEARFPPARFREQ